MKGLSEAFVEDAMAYWECSREEAVEYLTLPYEEEVRAVATSIILNHSTPLPSLDTITSMARARVLQDRKNQVVLAEFAEFLKKKQKGKKRRLSA
ncbi:MAG: hypothetical protein WDZ61_00620 [Parcubacteria group bacterium]